MPACISSPSSSAVVAGMDFSEYHWLLLAVDNLAPRAAMGRFLPVKAHPLRWLDPMQTTAQVECKWMVKSMQLRIHQSPLENRGITAVSNPSKLDRPEQTVPRDIA